MPLPPYPPPPLTPVILLPPRHIATPLIAPRRHRDKPRVSAWDWAGLSAPPATLDATGLGAPLDWTALEPAVRSHRFGAAARFAIEAAAALLPDGYVIDLHPQHDLLLPRHGTLVNIGRSTGRPAAEETPRELLPPHAATYDVLLSLVQPRAPAVDFSRGAERLASLDALGDAAFQPAPDSYVPSCALVKPRAPAISFGKATRLEPAGGGQSPELPEGGVLLLELGEALGRAARLLGAGVLPFARMSGRDRSAGDAPQLVDLEYDIDLAVVKPRVPQIDFSRAPPRDGSFVGGTGGSGGRGEGDVLLLEPSHALVERAPHAVDFTLATERPPPAAIEAVPEGRVLELHPQPDMVLPHHGSLVTMRRPVGSAGRRRVKRQEVVRVDDAILCEIERELAALPPMEPVQGGPLGSS